MNNPFLRALLGEVGYTKTENNAKTLRSSDSAVLDLFAAGAAWRTRSEADIVEAIELAWLENAELTLKCLFYLRDVRGGQGERRTFRIALQHLAGYHRDALIPNLQHVAEYGRWDDLISLGDAEFVTALLLKQLQADIAAERPSLLAKWMPSGNTASRATRHQAKLLMAAFGWTPRQYRKTLSGLREKLRVVERDMCAKRWGSIIYAHVPSNASLRYRRAFKKRDCQRYTEYLASVKKGEIKINSGTLYPYDLVHQVWKSPGDDTIDLQWAALPNYMDKPTNALVMADTSGSMAGRPIEVSISLAIYIAERNQGPFHNLYMTFSSRPTICQVSGKTLYEKVHTIKPIVENTDIMAAFREVLRLAKKSKATQEDIPQMLLIISDMEFDQASANNKRTNFEQAAHEFKLAGYRLPTVVFWQVDQRNRQQPVRQHQSGAVLVSGMSPSILKQVMNFSQSPYDLMLKTLNSERYAAISLRGENN
jgi:hypothetical protein